MTVEQWKHQHEILDELLGRGSGVATSMIPPDCYIDREGHQIYEKEGNKSVLVIL